MMEEGWWGRVEVVERLQLVREGGEGGRGWERQAEIKSDLVPYEGVVAGENWRR